MLTAAFRGDLTKDWRKRNYAGPLAGPNLYSEVQLDDGERGIWGFCELPPTWEWRNFRDTFVDVTDSARKLQQKSYLIAGLYPVIDQGEKVIGGYSDRCELVHQADPPYIIFGDHTRCIKFVEVPFVQGADGVKFFKTDLSVMPVYGRFALAAVQLPDKGYSRHMKFVRETLFPIAPVEEQPEIISRIERAFTWIDRLASEATSARGLIDRLDLAVLAKAFRGELVPQDPTDEPASVLLERIRVEREAKPRRGKKKASKKTAG